MHPFLLTIITLLFSLSATLSVGAHQAPPELKGLGTSTSVPKGGIAVQGEIPEAWPENTAIMVIFFSTLTPNTTIDPEELRERDISNAGIQILAVSQESPKVIRERLSLPSTEKASSNQYPIIISDPNGNWKKMLLDPTGRTRLPAAVAIDRGSTISWHGPGTNANFGPPLAMHSTNTWNTQAYRKQIERTYLRNENRKRIADIRTRAKADGNVENALSEFDRVIESDPTSPDPMVERFTCLLVDLNRPELAYAYGRTLAQSRPNDYITLNAMSWKIVSAPELNNRNLEFAQEMSERANGIQKYANYTLVDTLARIYWMRGDRARAIDWQRKAVALAPDSWHGDACRENLSTYVSGNSAPSTLPTPYRSPRRR